MKKDPLSESYENLVQRGKNLHAKLQLSGRQGMFKITADEMTALEGYVRDGTQANDLATQADDFKKSVTEYRRKFFHGAREKLRLPLDPNIGTASSQEKTGGYVEFLRYLIQKIKSNKNDYTVAIGDDLGIEGVETVLNVDDYQPVLHVKIIADDELEFVCEMKGYNSYNIYANFHDAIGAHLLANSDRRKRQQNILFPAEAREWDFWCRMVEKGKEVGHHSLVSKIVVKKIYGNNA